jgi:hypothetical protein
MWLRDHPEHERMDIIHYIPDHLFDGSFCILAQADTREERVCHYQGKPCILLDGTCCGGLVTEWYFARTAKEREACASKVYNFIKEIKP